MSGIALFQPKFYLRAFGRRYPAFLALGTLGFVGAVALGFILAACRGLSPVVIAQLSAVAAMAFLALIWLCRLLTGIERIVYYITT